MAEGGVSINELAALGRKTREKTSDVQRRRLASLERPEPEGRKLCCSAELVGEGGHAASVAVFLEGGAVRFWGLDASSLVAGHADRTLRLATVARVVRDGEREVLVWLTSLPPLLVRLSSSTAADQFAMAVVEHMDSTAGEGGGAAERSGGEDRTSAAATALAHLSHACWQGRVRDGAAFLEQLGRTGWLDAVGSALSEAVGGVEEEDGELEVRLLRRMLRHRKWRTDSALAQLLREAAEGTATSRARVLALGSDEREGGRVWAAAPGMPRLLLLLDCVWQALRQRPSAFAFGESALRLVAQELRHAGTPLTEEFYGLLAGRTQEEEEIMRQQDDLNVEEEEEEEMLEPQCEPWCLALCPFIFLSCSSEAPVRRGQEVEQLRATIARLLAQVAAQDAALRALHNSQQHAEQPAEKREEKEPTREDSGVLRVRRAETTNEAVPKARRAEEAIRHESHEQRRRMTPPEGSGSPFRVRNAEKEDEARSSTPEQPASLRLRAAEMAEALRHSLARRGETLEAAGDATAEMEARSGGLLELTRQLNAEAQAKKTRWGLF